MRTLGRSVRLVCILAVSGAVLSGADLAMAGGGGAFHCPNPNDPGCIEALRIGNAPLYQPVRISNRGGSAISRVEFLFPDGLDPNRITVIDLMFPADASGAAPNPPFTFPGGTASFGNCLEPGCFFHVDAGEQQEPEGNWARRFWFDFTGFDPGDTFDFFFDADVLTLPAKTPSTLNTLPPFAVDVWVVVGLGPGGPAAPRWEHTELNDIMFHSNILDRDFFRNTNQTLLVEVPGPPPLALLLAGLLGGAAGAWRWRRK